MTLEDALYAYIIACEHNEKIGYAEYTEMPGGERNGWEVMYGMRKPRTVKEIAMSCHA
ncbi:MAG: hypothetical protein ACRC3H_02635 [Lachnospiraceae bacterium]